MNNINNTMLNILNGNCNKSYKFHLVGIGGVSMFFLAMLLKGLNQEVSGSDTNCSDNTKKLKKQGKAIFFQQR